MIIPAPRPRKPEGVLRQRTCFSQAAGPRAPAALPRPSFPGCQALPLPTRANLIGLLASSVTAHVSLGQVVSTQSPFFSLTWYEAGRLRKVGGAMQVSRTQERLFLGYGFLSLSPLPPPVPSVMAGKGVGRGSPGLSYLGPLA